MCQDWWPTLRCNGTLKEALWYSEQRPVSVQGVDGWRRLQQLCIGINLWHLQDPRSTITLMKLRIYPLTWERSYYHSLWCTWSIKMLCQTKKNLLSALLLFQTACYGCPYYVYEGTESVFTTHRLLFWIKGLLQRFSLFIQPVSGRSQVSQRLWKHAHKQLHMLGFLFHC